MRRWEPYRRKLHSRGNGFISRRGRNKRRRKGCRRRCFGICRDVPGNVRVGSRTGWLPVKFTDRETCYHHGGQASAGYILRGGWPIPIERKTGILHGASDMMRPHIFNILSICRQQGFIGKNIYALDKPAGRRGNQAQGRGRKNIRATIACSVQAMQQIILERCRNDGLKE